MLRVTDRNWGLEEVAVKKDGGREMNNCWVLAMCQGLMFIHNSLQGQ